MMRAGVAALLLAATGPALAGPCPSTISSIVWDDGTTDTVSSRASDMLMLDSEIAVDGGNTFRSVSARRPG
ncbi:hypothetical protein MASR1M32_17180 [Rhodobacter sp.]